MLNVLITGANGQLGQCIKDLETNYNGLNFIYTDYQDLDICNLKQVNTFFKKQSINYCINCAAYTAVDKAEEEKESAYKINEIGAKNLALVCKDNNTILIHISTDFVFDGQKANVYLEIDETRPINVYGASKLKGEIKVLETLKEYFIIRTSWLYSEYGNNYLKTMLKLAKEKDELNIIYDQVGTPTYAGDLALFILKIISGNFKNYGIYHYSNEGIAGWYDFTKAIYNISDINIKVKPIKTEQYKQYAERPKYSVLDKSKTKNTFKIEIPYWRESLKKIILKMNNQVNEL